MKNRKGKPAMRMIALLLSAVAIFGLGGCKKPAGSGDIIEGGVTEKTDRKAPKIIASKDITDFYATFCLMGEWSSGRKNEFYTFAVKPNESGTLTASEQITGVSAPADNTLLTALQEIVDARKLAEWNGEYRTTAGLPPEFWPCTVTVGYASGEKLTFTHNNDPDAAWAKEMYLAFADWFAARGINDLLPPETVVGAVANVSLTFKDNAAGKACDYGIWTEPNEAGQRVLFCFDEDGRRDAPLADMRAFCDGVTEIMRRYDLRRYDVHSALYGYEQTEEDQKDPFSNDLELVFWFDETDNSDQLLIHTSVPEEIDRLRPLIGELIDYFDAQFPE